MSQECSPLPACLLLRKGWTGGQIRGPCPAPCPGSAALRPPRLPVPSLPGSGKCTTRLLLPDPSSSSLLLFFCFPSTTGRNVCLSKVSTHTLQLLLQRFTFFLRAANSVFQAWFEDITKQTETKRMKIFFSHYCHVFLCLLPLFPSVWMHLAWDRQC